MVMNTLSIIVVNYKMAPLVKLLMESLLSDATLPARTEILVVDNNSQDNSVELLRSDFPEITVIDNKENIGLAGGVNIALEQAKGKYTLLLNPDIVAMPGAVKTLVDFMENNPDVGMAGGKLFSPNGSLQYSCYRFYTPMTILYRRTPLGKTKKGREAINSFLMKDYDHEEARDVDWLMGACLITRKEVLKKVGGMDPRFFLYFEDVDWCRRVREAGFRVTYVPSAHFSHFHQRSSEKGSILGLITNRATREHIISAFKYFWKFRGKTLPK